MKIEWTSERDRPTDRQTDRPKDRGRNEIKSKEDTIGKIISMINRKWYNEIVGVSCACLWFREKERKVEKERKKKRKERGKDDLKYFNNDKINDDLLFCRP